MRGAIAAAISDADARALISVFGALLAAFGFFYTGVRDDVRTGLMRDPKDDDDRKANHGLVREAFWPGMVLLASSSTLVAGLMAPPFLDVLGTIDRSEDYSPSKTALGVLSAFWLVLAAFWSVQAVRAAYRLATWK